MRATRWGTERASPQPVRERQAPWAGSLFPQPFPLQLIPYTRRNPDLGSEMPAVTVASPNMGEASALTFLYPALPVRGTEPGMDNNTQC